uniref:glutamate--cysteine ligase n=1 Tax=Rhizochromulina marina TaxID=1034831 RepID=A0A7S2SEH8_9STRA|mmetsp:Transcript_29016/g.84724  ORF Transcript_29016/g.84724 Transcript_29016/m.84724 type:complete len:458 (+) Transcript_29016:18-1391(+)
MSALRGLAARYERCFPEALRLPMRTVGREAEYPIVTPLGHAGNVQAVMARLRDDSRVKASQVVMENELIASITTESSVHYTIEVGTGTVEVISGPFMDLESLREVHEDSVELLVDAAKEEGLCVLGCGIQPLTRPSAALMTPRERYNRLMELLPGWAWFSATASDQVHVDITREEFPLITSVCNAATPALVALCGNSGVHSGLVADTCCTREAATHQVMGHRHGMPEAPVSSVDEWMEQIATLDFLMRKDHPKDTNPRVAYLNDDVSLGLAPFSDHLGASSSASQGQVTGSRDEQDWEDFLFHEHYVYHSARPRSKQATVELRPCCQQPWADHMVVAALSLGLVQSGPRLLPFLVPSYEAGASGAWHGALAGRWAHLQGLHHRAVTTGLEDDEVAELCKGILTACAQALEERGLGEEAFLEPLFQRVEERENPAQQLQRAMRDVGMKGVVDLTEIRP